MPVITDGIDGKEAAQIETQVVKDPAATPAPKPEETAEFWKSRYDGANRKIQQQAEALKATEGNYKSTLSTYAEKLAQEERAKSELANQLAEREKIANEINSKYEQATKEAATFKTQMQRFTIIQSEAPELLSYASRGLLRDTFNSDDEFRSYIHDFSDTLQGIRRDATIKDLSGAVPPATPPQSAGVPTKQMLWAEFDKAVAQKDWDTAKKLENQIASVKEK